MHTVVEIWTPKQRFLDASTQERQSLFTKVGAAMPQLEAAGVSCLGWGAVQPAPHSTGHQWIAVWQMTSEAAVERFLAAVEEAGWYDHFDQVNALSELVPVPEALEQLMAVGG
jgi:hypothetical protein